MGSLSARSGTPTFGREMSQSAFVGRRPFAPCPSRTLFKRLPLRGTSPTNCAEMGVGLRITPSALLPRLRHEPRKLWSHLGALALGARRLRLFTLRDRHDELEGLLALFAEELVPRHGVHPAPSGTRDTLSSSSVDRKDLIPSVNRSLHSHRDHGPARSLRHRLVLDLE
jgi:hypothetical protein